MEGIGFPLDQMIRDGQLLLPLTHAEADYDRPLRHGESVQVQVRVLEIRQRSFAIGYRFIDSRQEVAATARTVHVQISGTSTPAATLPVSLRKALSSHLGANPAKIRSP